jgi:hypothetical protein
MTAIVPFFRELVTGPGETALNELAGLHPDRSGAHRLRPGCLRAHSCQPSTRILGWKVSAHQLNVTDSC